VAEEVAGAFSVRLTLTVRVIPPPVTVMVPVLLPTAAVGVLTLTVRVPLFDPDVGLTVSQLALSAAVQLPLDVRVID
jgi:hypothetical protein